jgi:hypothetical protein
MPQIQRVADQPGRGAVRHPQHAAEFSSGEIPDGRGAVPTQPHRVLGARQPTLRDRLAGMQIRPMRRDLQTAGFGGDQGVFVSLRRGQRAGRVQLDQLIIEHAFNIRLSADTHRRLGRATANGQHLTDLDNTSTTARSRAIEPAIVCIGA